MKRATLTLVALGLSLGCGSGETSRPAEASDTRGPGDTTDTAESLAAPVPRSPPDVPLCTDRAPDAVRFVATGPITPLAIADGDGLRSAGQPCCAPWTDRGREWHALDAYGHSRGTARVVEDELYDVTNCQELVLDGPAGRFDETKIDTFEPDQVWAFASPYQEPESDARWTPSEDDVAALREWLSRLDTLVVERPETNAAPSRPGPTFEERVLYFRDHDPYIGQGSGEFRYAIIGGRYLVIARRVSPGRFVISHLEQGMTNESMAHPRMYLPAAAADLGGTAGVEVVYRWNEMPSWGTRVLRRRQGVPDSWSQAAEDLGGATI